MRIGLSLGAGGVVGASWLVGALEGREAQTGFRAAECAFWIGQYEAQFAAPPLSL